MVAVGISKKVKVLALGHQCVDHLHRILEMDIVVGRTVDQQELAFELFCMVDGAVVVVTVGILLLLWHAHLAHVYTF